MKNLFDDEHDPFGVRLAKTVLVLILIGAAMVFFIWLTAGLNPGVAQADADTPMEHAYIAALDEEGIAYTSEDDAIRDGYGVCGAFRNGEALDQIVDEAMRGSGLPLFTVSYIVGASVAAFCPDVNPFKANR